MRRPSWLSSSKCPRELQVENISAAGQRPAGEVDRSHLQGNVGHLIRLLLCRYWLWAELHIKNLSAARERPGQHNRSWSSATESWHSVLGEVHIKADKHIHGSPHATTAALEELGLPEA